MNPVRVDLTMRLADELGVLGRSRRSCRRPIADRRADRDRPRRGADRGRAPGRRRPGPGRPRARARHRRQPGLRGHARGRPRTSSGASVEAARRVWTGEVAARGQHRRRPAPRDARPGQRLLRLQRRRGRDPVAARPRRRAGRLRRRRRPPRRRRRADLLRRPAGAHDLACTRPARCSSPAPASRPTAGGPGAEGTAVNVALPPGTADAGWLRAFHAVVPPLLREFAPDVLVTQHGCDSHIDDPLAHLMLSVDGQRAPYLALHDLAHEVARRALGRHRRRRLRGRRRGARGPGPTCSRSSPGGRSTRRPRRRRGGGRTCASCSARTAPQRMTDGRTPAYRDWAEGYDPEHLAGPRDPRHPDGGLPAARPRPAPLSRGSARRRGQVKIQRDTPRVTQVSLSFPLPHPSH